VLIERLGQVERVELRHAFEGWDKRDFSVFKERITSNAPPPAAFTRYRETAAEAGHG
jgi:hypothetical protein